MEMQGPPFLRRGEVEWMKRVLNWTRGMQGHRNQAGQGVQCLVSNAVGGFGEMSV